MCKEIWRLNPTYQTIVLKMTTSFLFASSLAGSFSLKIMNLVARMFCSVKVTVFQNNKIHTKNLESKPNLFNIVNLNFNLKWFPPIGDILNGLLK